MYHLNMKFLYIHLQSNLSSIIIKIHLYISVYDQKYLQKTYTNIIYIKKIVLKKCSCEPAQISRTLS